MLRPLKHVPVSVLSLHQTLTSWSAKGSLAQAAIPITAPYYGSLLRLPITAPYYGSLLLDQ